MEHEIKEYRQAVDDSRINPFFIRNRYISNGAQEIARKETYSSNSTNSFILARSNEAIVLAFLEVQ